MEISELTLKLILILIPGCISCVIYEKLTIHKTWSPFKFIVNAIIFGAISYLLAQFIFQLFDADSGFISFWKNLPSKEIPYSVIVKTSLVSIIVGLSIVSLDYFKLINRFGKLIHITNKYGDESLFYYFLNRKDILDVYIRDIDNGLTYLGDIVAYTENESTVEIVLKDVVVYSYGSSEEYYQVSEIYISRNKENLIIEKPKKE